MKNKKKKKTKQNPKKKPKYIVHVGSSRYSLPQSYNQRFKKTLRESCQLFDKLMKDYQRVIDKHNTRKLPLEINEEKDLQRFSNKCFHNLTISNCSQCCKFLEEAEQKERSRFIEYEKRRIFNECNRDYLQKLAKKKRSKASKLHNKIFKEKTKKKPKKKRKKKKKKKNNFTI